MKLPDFRFDPTIQNLHRSMGIEVRHPCKVCGGAGEVSGELSIYNGSHLTHGPDYKEVEHTAKCTDCDGSGEVCDDIHAEQSGERNGTPEEWAQDILEKDYNNDLL
tara:strand:+ start:425 stop:742 length:318 start_codon:yes stop_codon:yes gene_type:complete